MLLYCADTKTNGNGPKADPVTDGKGTVLPEFYVPPLVLIVGLCLIVFLALLSLVLIILQCRRSGRRKRRNRAANRESLLSAKSEAGCSSSTKDLDLGVTTYRATRSFPSFAPGPPQAVPQPQPQLPGPGHPVTMRYQKGTPDDTGYVSGSSNHYSEPYGCHDEPGTAERTRSAQRPSMPQIKGSPQPPRLPDNHP
ncbi:hypothetical protein V1264_017961 [Littorina saxatilis]|uniref:Uncharacterized protein n=1 Tax=Littorina saxatilis TaxID=31220 RepID=A0AAN9BJL8_9CAEN